MKMKLIFALCLGCCFCMSHVSGTLLNIGLQISNFTPEYDDLYVCTGINLTDYFPASEDNKSKQTMFAVKFTPFADMITVHHMLIFACSEPGYYSSLWRCGGGWSNHLVSRTPCLRTGRIIYAWGRNAAEFQLPKDIGFKLGPGVGLNSLVLQAHFTKGNAETGQIGVNVSFTTDQLPKKAALFIMQSGGRIGPKSADTFDIKCTASPVKPLRPFAYRVHTHWHGRLGSGYIVRNKTWHLIGKRSPAMPQAFIPVENTSLQIENGDYLTARCYMVNDEDRTVYVGSRARDEMCNFYVMYWVASNETLYWSGCYTSGPPYYYWDQSEEHIGLPPANTNHLDLFS